MRRTPAATPLSPRTVIRPMSPVRRTWVPPHSSTDQPSALPVGVAHRHDAHLVAVFLAEQRARAGLLGVVERHQPRLDRRVLQHDVVGDVLDLRSISCGGDRLGVDEVEAQAVGRDQRALLRDVIAEHQAQRLVQQVRRRMVGADRASGARDRRRAPAASPTLSVPSLDLAVMARRGRRFFCGVDHARSARRRAVIVPVSPTWPPLSP